MEREERRKRTLFSVLFRKFESAVHAWLLYEEKEDVPPLQDFKKMCANLEPGDVLLFEGKSRISRAISVISQSQWTHAALYIGTLEDFSKDPELKAILKGQYDGDPKQKLVVESLLGKGMVVTPLSEYTKDSIRLCRPRGILSADAKHVVSYAIRQVGREYDVRQLLDLARFIFPYAILPRRWLSSLFSYRAGGATRTVCSTVIAEAFMHVKFPVVPVLLAKEQRISLARRNPRLITPRDFDYSPYFEVIKFPNVSYDQNFLGLPRKGGYREMPWEHNESIYCNSMRECFISEKEEEEGKKPSDKEVQP